MHSQCVGFSAIHAHDHDRRPGGDCCSVGAQRYDGHQHLGSAHLPIAGAHELLRPADNPQGPPQLCGQGRQGLGLLVVPLTAWDDEMDDPLTYAEAVERWPTRTSRRRACAAGTRRAAPPPNRPTCCADSGRTEGPGSAARGGTRRTAREAVEDGVACCGIATAARGDPAMGGPSGPRPHLERGAAT
jgi:hypothetical protein